MSVACRVGLYCAGGARFKRMPMCSMCQFGSAYLVERAMCYNDHIHSPLKFGLIGAFLDIKVSWRFHVPKSYDSARYSIHIAAARSDRRFNPAKRIPRVVHGLT